MLTTPPKLYTLSLHDALPISLRGRAHRRRVASGGLRVEDGGAVHARHLRRWRRPHTPQAAPRAVPPAAGRPPPAELRRDRRRARATRRHLVPGGDATAGGLVRGRRRP